MQVNSLKHFSKLTNGKLLIVLKLNPERSISAPEETDKSPSGSPTLDSCPEFDSVDQKIILFRFSRWCD